MRKLIVLSLAVLMTGIFTINAADESMVERSRLAAKLLEVRKIGKILDQTFAWKKRLEAAMKKHLTTHTKNQTLIIKYQQEMVDLLKKTFSWEKIEPELKKIYSETYTIEELKGLIKFFQSPIGKKFTLKEPQMQQKVMEVFQKMYSTIMPKLNALGNAIDKEIQEEIIAAKKD